MAAIHYFSPPLPETATVRRQGPLIRSVRTGDVDMTLECGDEIGVTLELSDACSWTRRVDGRSAYGHGVFGNVTISVPGQRIHVATRGAGHGVQLALPLATVEAMAGEDHDLDGARSLIAPTNGAPDWSLLRLIFRAATRTEPEEQQETLREVVAHLLAGYADSPERTVRLNRAGIAAARLRRVRDRVEADLHGVSVAVMAEEAGLSPFHFAREFRRTTGQSPWGYVVSRRLARAVELMARSEAPLDLVARDVGFAHASHLTNRMRESMGCSPTQVRRHLLN